MKQRLRATWQHAKTQIRPKRSWQGPVGAGLVVAGVWVLTAPAWALLTAGGFLLLAALTGA